MTDIQPGQRFSLYNGSGTWGHFEGEVTKVEERWVHYTLKGEDGTTEHKITKEAFTQLVEQGYVEMKE